MQKAHRRRPRKGPKNPKLEDGPADIVFHGGDIYTIDDNQPKVEALAVKGEEILTLGPYQNIKSLIDTNTEVIDLKGKTLLPGFIECHQHATLAASNRFLFTDIRAVGDDLQERDKAIVLEIISKEIAETDPSEDPLPWCIFFGWDIELIPDLPQLNAKELDKLSTEIPIMVVAQNGHAAWVNHKTFEVCNITSPDQCPPGGMYVVDENGELTGMLLEEPAIMSIIKHHPISPDMGIDVAKAVYDQWRFYATRGYTTVTELAYSTNPEMDQILSATAALHDCPIRLGLYVSASHENEPQIQESSKLWVAGRKIWADGSPHCGTAAVKDPYLDTELTRQLAFPPPPPPPPIPDPPKCGILNWNDDELFQMVKKHHDAGRQISIHAHGERAVDQGLNAYKQVMKPGDDHRHRFEHLGFVTEDQIKVCGELGVVPSFFVHQLYYYGHTFSDHMFGAERTARWTPLATAMEHVGEDKISLHEDHPSFPGPPHAFASIKSAVTRSHRHDPNRIFGKEYCITVDQAIKAYTIGPAYQLFKEDEIGSLEVGKYADLLIVSANPYKIDPLKLDTDVKIVETYIGGRRTNVQRLRKRI
ncbi:putative amidohydrolase YtcJ [Dysidea avara]|uniref:putative amidohydrolase YtcJ n=1 Tax=Dysidea avara TaxID=196820 RepID=UPI00331E66BF